jgi:hypothetical protein
MMKTKIRETMDILNKMRTSEFSKLTLQQLGKKENFGKANEVGNSIF